MSTPIFISTPFCSMARVKSSSFRASNCCLLLHKFLNVVGFTVNHTLSCFGARRPRRRANFLFKFLNKYSHPFVQVCLGIINLLMKIWMINVISGRHAIIVKNTIQVIILFIFIFQMSFAVIFKFIRAFFCSYGAFYFLSHPAVKTAVN